MVRQTALHAATVCLFAAVCGAFATDLSSIRGIVHDPSHRPVKAAQIALVREGTAAPVRAETDEDGAFTLNNVASGNYTLTVDAPGFSELKDVLKIASGQAPVLHFQLQIPARQQQVEVSERAEDLASDSATPDVIVTRNEISQTPGASLTNSLNMITDFVPGAYVTHDQLHIRGGHQVTWALDGVPVPNTNIASNVGPQIDPKDIDTLEVQRGGFSSEYGDRTYGVFDVVPRTGFERNREMEVNVTGGSFGQTDDELNLGDHSEKAAYYASINGNRSDYGLETPGPEIHHDAEWGMGGFGSFVYNPTASDQLRLLITSRGDEYEIPDSADLERERDSVATFTWVHNFTGQRSLTISPFYHRNSAHYDGNFSADAIGTTQHSDSDYAGGQIAVAASSSRHDARLGLYGFGQSQDEFVAVSDFGSRVGSRKASGGQLEAVFGEDQWHLTPSIILTAGARATHFGGAVAENAFDPRVGLSVRLPRLHWILRGFYGRYYQAPPLSTVAGPLVQYAAAQGLGIIPLHGERDEENQAGLTIPLKGWSVDLNSFRLRARNYFDHNSVGDSNVFFPLSIAGARISGQEVTVQTPTVLRWFKGNLAYSYQHAEAEGAITGGLTDFSPPSDGYFALDHDQRHTLHGTIRANLPHQVRFAVSTYYGSGFKNGEAEDGSHLQPHTTVDLSVGKSIGDRFSVAVNGLNIANRRFLLDNSSTFGGTHYADPRQIYLDLRYRFHF